jgi:integrase
MLSFAVGRNLLRSNPALGVKTFKVRKCERFLTTEELARIGEALRAAEAEGITWIQNPDAKAKHRAKDGNDRTRINPFAAAALRLLLLTGARLREVLDLEWSQVDFERGLLLLPDSKTGKKQIALNAPALAVLAGLPRIGRYVIAGETAGQPGEKPRADLQRPWHMVCRAAGVEGVRIHDLRHTHALIGAAAGLGLPIIGKLLVHTQASTTARYAHLADDPVRRASERIGSDIAAALGEARPGVALVGGSVEPIRKSKHSDA